MAKDRNEMLKYFLKNKEFIAFLENEKICPTSISFSEPSNNLLVEAMKKMILSYCLDDSNLQTQKKINALILSEVRNS